LVLALGIPEDEYEIQKAIGVLDLEEQVIRTGHVSKEEFRYLLRRSDIFAMCNIRVKGDFEGFGLVCLEAAREGALVLASSIEGITSAIDDGKNGIWVESGNAREWIEKIKELVTDKKKLNDKIEKFTEYTLTQTQNWGMMVKEYFEYLEKLTV